jgi:DNA-binding XRE family transcriptional regulator
MRGKGVGSISGLSERGGPIIEGDIGSKLLRLRMEMALTQKEASEMFGCTQSQICKWENGLHKPSKLRNKQLEDRVDGMLADLD